MLSSVLSQHHFSALSSHLTRWELPQVQQDRNTLLSLVKVAAFKHKSWIWSQCFSINNTLSLFQSSIWSTQEKQLYKFSAAPSWRKYDQPTTHTEDTAECSCSRVSTEGEKKSAKEMNEQDLLLNMPILGDFPSFQRGAPEPQASPISSLSPFSVWSLLPVPDMAPSMEKHCSGPHFNRGSR